MKILFMGTGAADYDINVRSSDEFFRRNSTILIDNDLMIDCSPHVPDYISNHNIDLSNVKNILITHSHADHYSPTVIDSLFNGNVQVWSEKNTEDFILKDLNGYPKSVLPLFEHVKIGKYDVMAMPANHSVGDRNQMPLCYMVSDGAKRLFWGCDGAWLPTDTWNTIKQYKFDLMVFDGTLGNVGGDARIFEHNSLPLIRGIMDAVREQRLLNNNGIAAISHISKYSQLPHDELTKEMKKIGVTVAYDGLILEL